MEENTKKKKKAAKNKVSAGTGKTARAPKVSVIISVYNQEDYLKKCLDSLLNQTLEEIEVIAVDDSSEDSSLSILTEYAGKDDRLIVEQQSHAGAAAARNKGLSMATGEYLSVLDSDDFFELDMLEKVYENAREEEADIVVFRSDSFDQLDENFKKNTWSILPDRHPGDVFNADDIPDRIFNIGAAWAWDKLFRREFVESCDVRFQDLRTTNDMLFVLYLYTRAEKISFLNDVLAHKRINNARSLSSTREKSWRDVFFALKGLKERLYEEGAYEKYRQSFVNWALNLLLWHIKTLKKEESDKLKDMCREEYFESLDITGNEEDYYYDQNEMFAMQAITAGPVAVSVIVPVYDASAYLRQCLDSICSQTLRNIEIICVDDGSTDESYNILFEYADRDPRIHVIRKEHSNAGDARNTGLEVAVGEYLSFLDADDFFEPHMLETVYNHSKAENSDVCMFRSDHFDHNSGGFNDTPWTLRDWEMPPHRPFSSNDVADKVFNMSSCTAWDKLFRKEFIFENLILFQSNPISNDMLFTFTALALAERISTIDEILAHMRVGHPKAMAKDIEYCTSCFATALAALKEGLETRGIYEAFRKSYVNWAIDFSLFSMHAFQGVFSNLIRQQLKLRFFEELGISDTPDEDFYDHGQCEEMRSIMSERQERDSDAAPKVSVLIPIYNVAHYLPLALDSAIYQTLEDIEIICINDGSTDNSLDIINEYASKDSRIKVITGENKGYGHAMNQGLDAAKGEYIGIIEPDDFVDVNMYKELYEAAKDNELDYVKGDFNRFTHDEYGNIQLVYNEVAKSKSNYNVVKDPQTDGDVFRYVMNTWSGIYSRKLIENNKIRHNETPGASFQDNGFWFLTLIHSSRIFFINKPFYYNRRDNPDSSVASKEKVYCMNEEYALIRKKLDKEPELKEHFIYQYNRMRFINYIFTFDRLGEEYKYEYITSINAELKEADEKEEIDWSLFTVEEFQDLRLLLERPMEFYSHETFREYDRRIKNDRRIIEKLQKENDDISYDLKEKQRKITALQNALEKVTKEYNAAQKKVSVCEEEYQKKLGMMFEMFYNNMLYPEQLKGASLKNSGVKTISATDVLNRDMAVSGGASLKEEKARTE